MVGTNTGHIYQYKVTQNHSIVLDSETVYKGKKSEGVMSMAGDPESSTIMIGTTTGGVAHFKLSSGKSPEMLSDSPASEE